MKKKKLYSVTFIPNRRQKPYEVEQCDEDVNRVAHVAEWTESDYMDGITNHPEKYFVRVYANNEEDSILKSEKLIEKYIKEKKK
jgi:hypothetical protein